MRAEASESEGRSTVSGILIAAFPVLAHTKLRKQLTTKVSVLVDRVFPETKEKILFAVGRQES